jgi:L-malate glycosyltransferase
MNYSAYIWKRRIENVFIFPFIVIGRLIALTKPLSKEYQTYFFFPFYHTGGAEKVHALVSQAVGNKNCIIFFTRKSVDQNFLDEFLKPGCTVKDISKFTDNKFIYFVNLVYRGIISGYINRQSLKPVVFNGQCNFGYKLSPWVKKEIPQLELIHSFNTFSWIRLPFLPFISRTIMISQVRVEDHLKQYQQLKVPAAFKARIQHIINGIDLPANPTPKHIDEHLNLLYVGRGTEEKRVHIVAQIAKKAKDMGLPITVNFLGEVGTAIPPSLQSYCNMLGHTSSAAGIAAAYENAHVLAITSNTEGFPMVIEEAMAHGCAIMATPVGDIPIHITKDNGLVFSTVDDEDQIVEEAVMFLSKLIQARALLSQISAANISYARATFAIENFNTQYRQLFQQLRSC